MALGRRDRRSTTELPRAVTAVFEVRARVAGPRDAVWQVLWEPGTSRAICPQIVHALAIPAAGLGVGEIHVPIEMRPEGGLSIEGIVVEAMRVSEFVRYRAIGAVEVSSLNELTFAALDGSEPA